MTLTPHKNAAIQIKMMDDYHSALLDLVDLLHSRGESGMETLLMSVCEGMKGSLEELSNYVEAMEGQP